ncbi:MAG: hypothetical protein KCHDKBKB_01612 [Elusimicrobia bacterium]|nr:hypothetical protein [Elusimicrobiota bacterium]
MSLLSKLAETPVAKPSQPSPPINISHAANSGDTKWVVIAPDIFPGEEIVCVIDPAYLKDAEAENPGLVIYTLSEIDALTPFEHDTEFRRKIHLAKKTFGGFVRKADLEKEKVETHPTPAVTV